jgi:hypothetical protein
MLTSTEAKITLILKQQYKQFLNSIFFMWNVMMFVSILNAWSYNHKVRKNTSMECM